MGAIQSPAVAGTQVAPRSCLSEVLVCPAGGAVVLRRVGDDPRRQVASWVNRWRGLHAISNDQNATEAPRGVA